MGLGDIVVIYVYGGTVFKKADKE